jgi:TonB-dependent SusC/RagA subfamily outer membrane receptor
MKRILVLALAFVVTGSACDMMVAQSRKETRKARKEQLKREREITDSLKLVLFGEEKVNVGYGKTKKKDLVTAVSSVDVNGNAPIITDIGEFLMGKVPGLVVTKIGSSYRLNVRGATTVSGASIDPLVLLDGVEIDDISVINPNDVASVEVLKDAAAAAVYGSRGACGVVLITTKN